MPISLANAEKIQYFQHSVCGGYYTTQATTSFMKYLFDLFTFAYAKAEVIWLDTFVSDQSLALLDVVHINQVSGQTFGLRLKFDTGLSKS